MVSLSQGRPMPPLKPEETSTQQAAHWKEIVDITQEILAKAREMDWGQVDSLSQQRDQMLDDFFRQAIASELVEDIQEGIRNLIETDSEIVRLVTKNRSELAAEINTLQRRKKQIQDYISNSR